MFPNTALNVLAGLTYGVTYLAAISLNAGMSFTEYRKGLEENAREVYTTAHQQDWLAYSNMQHNNLTSWQVLNPVSSTFVRIEKRPLEVIVKTHAGGRSEFIFIGDGRKAENYGVRIGDGFELRIETKENK